MIVEEFQGHLPQHVHRVQEGVQEHSGMIRTECGLEGGDRRKLLILVTTVFFPDVIWQVNFLKGYSITVS